MPDECLLSYIFCLSKEQTMHISVLKILLCQSIDCCDTDQGGQATYHDRHKTVFFL